LWLFPSVATARKDILTNGVIEIILIDEILAKFLFCEDGSEFVMKWALKILCADAFFNLRRLTLKLKIENDRRSLNR